VIVAAVCPLLRVALFVLSAADPANAQNGARVSGQVVDATSGIGLSGVPVQIVGQPATALTDADGRFTLEGIPAGRHVLAVSVVGYALARRDIDVGEGGSISIVIPLAEGTGTYTERVEVTGDLFRQAETAVAAQQVLGSADLQNLRGLVLDDPVRAMQVLPGVAATDDLYADFSVRGASFGRIGLAIDGVPSRFLSHTVQGVEDGGSIGMINSDILASASLLGGSYPQRYGNRTGAQVEMTLRDGSRDKAQVRVALSGSSASVVGDGPIGGGRTASWLVSARKSYLDLLIKQITDVDAFAFGFSDLAGRVVWNPAADHRIQVSALGGQASLLADQLSVGVNDPHRAANSGWLGVVSWQHTPASRVAVTHRIGATGGDFRNQSLGRVVLDEGRSADVSVRSDLAATLSSAFTLEAGASVHWQDEQVVSRRVVSFSRPPDVHEDAQLDSRWTGAYTGVRWTPAGWLTVSTGSRVDHWDATGEIVASPWLGAELAVGGYSVVAGGSLNHQFPGFNAVTGLRGSPGARAERAWHADVGLSRRIGSHMRAQAVVFNREDRELLRLPDDEWRMVDGRPEPPASDTRYENRLNGTARGVELAVQRRSPNGLSGWVSYALGRYRQHDVVNGESFAGDFDQRHAFNVYGHYRLTDRTSVAVKFRTSSNFPVRGYFVELPATADAPVPDDQPSRYALAATRNGARLPAYARLDLRANRTWRADRGRLTLFVEFTNVGGRTNWRTGNGGIRPDGEIVGLLDPLVPFLPSAGLLWEF
jgi:hypothetical protein